MKKIKGLYNNSKLRTKLLFILGVSALFPILIILIISARLNTYNMTKKVDELMTTNLTQIAQRVNLSLEVYTNLLYQIYQDEEINENIKTFMSGEPNGYATAYRDINNRLKRYNTTDSGVRCISVVCTNGSTVVYDFGTDSLLNHLWKGYRDLRETDAYRMAEGEPGMVVVPTMTFKERDGMKHYFHIAKRVFDLENLDQGSIATIIMSIDVKFLEKICNTPSENRDKKEINFILNDEHKVISFPDEDFSGLKLREDLTIEEFVSLTGLMKGKKVYLSSYKDKATGWTFYNAYDREYMLQDVTNSLKLYATIGIVALLAATALLLYLLRQINSSVDCVIGGIREVQGGNLDVQVQVECHDEIGKIADNFNSMTIKVKKLIREVKTATDKQKNAEIRALEAQINPHFLYNTLDSINWMAIESGEYEISKMIRNLGIILRYSVNKSNSIVAVETVEDWLEKYVSLQKMRFEDIFTYEIHVEPQARKKRLHKLLLQPFLENAIMHGLKDMDGGGMLCVDISLSEDGTMLNIVIEDNGQGMSEEEVKHFNDREEAVKDDGRNIGLHNVFSRISMYYGEKAVWNITSIPQMGTVITLKLPVIE